jgi:hypothetical protein
MRVSQYDVHLEQTCRRDFTVSSRNYNGKSAPKTRAGPVVTWQVCNSREFCASAGVKVHKGAHLAGGRMSWSGDGGRNSGER